MPPDTVTKEQPVVARTLDGMETALLEGKVVDQNFNPVKADPDMQRPQNPHILDDAEQKSHKGELKTGEIGWIELSPEGKPVGAAQKFPFKDKPQAPVATIVETTPSTLATPAGAFLTDGNMNPSPAAYKYSSSAYGRDYKAAESARRQWKGLPPLEPGGAGSTAPAATKTNPSPPKTASASS